MNTRVYRASAQDRSLYYKALIISLIFLDMHWQVGKTNLTHTN